MQRPRRWSRRRWLARLGAGTAALAGCSQPEETPSESAAEGSTSRPPEPAGDREPTATESRRPATDDPTPTESATEPPAETAVTEPDTPIETPTATTSTPVHADYETTTVRAVDTEGRVLGRVTAAIADTRDLRYLGLSDTESLPPDRGMLFVYDGEADRTFVMRRMDFGIDIVYAAADGEITRIHHAPAPGPNEDGNEQRYPGHGRYVLEVNYEWTTDRGVSEGDLLEFEL